MTMNSALKVFGISLSLLLVSCDAGILLCGRYVCVAANSDCYNGYCESEELRCESAGITRDRIPQILNELRSARRNCYSGQNLGEYSDPLSWNDSLTAAATSHARDMAANDFLSFIGTDGSTTETRVGNAAENYDRVGEIILGQAQTSATAVNRWLDVETDCRLLMDADFTEVGAACAAAPNLDRGPYWSLVLGDPSALVE